MSAVDGQERGACEGRGTVAAALGARRLRVGSPGGRGWGGGTSVEGEAGLAAGRVQDLVV